MRRAERQRGQANRWGGGQRPPLAARSAAGQRGTAARGAGAPRAPMRFGRNHAPGAGGGGPPHAPCRAPARPSEQVGRRAAPSSRSTKCCRPAWNSSPWGWGPAGADAVWEEPRSRRERRGPTSCAVPSASEAKRTGGEEGSALLSQHEVLQASVEQQPVGLGPRGRRCGLGGTTLQAREEGAHLMRRAERQRGQANRWGGGQRPPLAARSAAT